MSSPSIQELNKLIMFSGKISEIHVKNLQSFPFIFFNGLVEAKLDYSVSTGNSDSQTIFNYDLTIDGENDNMDKRYKALESAIRNLFWKEAKVKVMINGLEVYKSE